MANRALKITCPLPPGAVGTGLATGHTIFKAHPGVPYCFVAGGHGGDPHYTFELSGHPSGMTINSDNGLVVWLNPTTGTHTGITVTMRDQSNNTSSGTFDLEVTTTGFKFLRPDGSDAADGSLSTSWATIDRLYDDTSDVIAYFLANTPGGSATFDFTNVPVSQGGFCTDDRWFFSVAAGRCTRWLARYGDNITLDFGSSHVPPTGFSNPDPAQWQRDNGYRPALRMASDYSCVDGFRILDGFNKFLWMDRGSGRGIRVTRNAFVNLGPGKASTNAAGVMYTHQTPTRNDVIALNTCENFGIGDSEISFLKFYDNIEAYVGFNTGDTDLFSVETIALKDSCQDYMLYRNDITSDLVALGGNNHSLTVTTRGEVWHCRFKGGTFALEFNQDSEAGPTFYERCTLEGPVHARNVDSADGVFTFRNDVVVNNDSGGSPWPGLADTFAAPPGTGSQDASRVSIAGGLTPTGTQSLIGSAAQVSLTAAGLLQGAQRDDYFGLKGHEIDFGEEPPPEVATVRNFRAGGGL